MESIGCFLFYLPSKGIRGISASDSSHSIL